MACIYDQNKMAMHMSQSWLIVALSGTFTGSLNKVFHMGTATFLPPAVILVEYIIGINMKIVGIEKLFHSI